MAKVSGDSFGLYIAYNSNYQPFYSTKQGSTYSPKATSHPSGPSHLRVFRLLADQATCFSSSSASIPFCRLANRQCHNSSPRSSPTRLKRSPTPVLNLKSSTTCNSSSCADGCHSPDERAGRLDKLVEQYPFRFSVHPAERVEESFLVVLYGDIRLPLLLCNLHEKPTNNGFANPSVGSRPFTERYQPDIKVDHERLQLTSGLSRFHQ